MSLNFDLVVVCINEIVGKCGSVDSAMGLTEVAHRASERISAAADHSKELPFKPLLLALVIGIHTKKPRLTEICLSCLAHLLSVRCIPPNLSFDISFSSSIAPILQGKSIVWAVLDALCESMGIADNAVQLKSLDCVASCVLDRRWEVSGPVLAKVCQYCFNLHLTSFNKTVRTRAAGTLKDIASKRIIAVFVDTSQPIAVSALNSSQHSLGAITPVEIQDPQGRVPLPTFDASLLDENQLEDDITETEPTDYLCIQVPFVAPRCLESNTSGSKDLLILLLAMLKLGSKPIPSTITTPDAIEVRARVHALSILQHIFQALPGSPTKQQEALLPDVVLLLKTEIWQCIAKNLAATAPFSMFQSAVDLLLQIAIKAHYPCHNWLRWFLELVVIPIAKSKFTPYEHRMCLIEFFQKLFALPEVILAYFCNYECLDSNFESGTLEFLINSLVEIMYLDFTTITVRATDPLLDPEKVSSLASSGSAVESGSATAVDSSTSGAGTLTGTDEVSGDEKHAVPYSSFQQRQVRTACANAVQKFVASLISWTCDPTGDEPSQGKTSGANGENSLSGEASLLLMYTPKEAEDEMSHLTEDSKAPNPFVGAVHWRVFHQLLCNKRIIEEARNRFNLNWRHGRQYMIDKGVINESAEAFANFLRFTPRLNKAQLCAMLEKVTRDAFAREIAKAYFATFTYRGVPLDVALRDTTLEFMSWSDRPQFEAQVWGTLQVDFGAEYAKQNEGFPGVVSTSDDADALAGVVLFLHTNLHNQKVGDKMSMDSFVRFGSDCLSQPLPPTEMVKIYERVAAAKWQPTEEVQRVTNAVAQAKRDAYGRNPILNAAQLPITAGEWGGSMQQYVEQFSSLDARQQSQLLYVQFVADCVDSFFRAVTQVHDLDAMWRIPFAIPVFAQHVKAILIGQYPMVAAAAYLCLRTATSQAELEMGTFLFQQMFALAELFSVPLFELQSSFEKALHKCLRQSHSVELGNLNHGILSCFQTFKI